MRMGILQLWPQIYADKRKSIGLVLIGVHPRSAAFKDLVSPDPYPINLHLLRKHRTAVGIAGKVPPNRNVEKDKERTLKLGGAVDSARDVCLGILDPIDVPLD